MSAKSLLIGVCGGIAAYKACALVSHLVQRGHDVDVIMTAEAQQFVTPLSFSALTHRPVVTSLWNDPVGVQHIELVRRAHAFIVVPATANTIAKLALGLGDDALTTAALAARIPLIVCPAMNEAMLEHTMVQTHLATLAKRGIHIVAPESGFLAEREIGAGRLADESTIIATIDAVLSSGMTSSAAGGREPLTDANAPIDGASHHDADPRTTRMHGLQVLITAGPTRESIDPVRFLTNAATGDTGIALARECVAEGATVTLVVGPTQLAMPEHVRVIHVTTAEEMYTAVHREATSHQPMDLIIATAAVADERPREPLAHKQKKREHALATLELEPTRDILGSLREIAPRTILVGFAAETESHEQHAQQKLREKQLDAIIVNDVGGGRGFGAQATSYVALMGDERIDFGSGKKSVLARKVADFIAERFFTGVASKSVQ